jgi:hypothetical protein
MFVIKRILFPYCKECSGYNCPHSRKTYFPQTYGPPHPTREAAEAHLAYVQKTVVGWSSPGRPYQFEVVDTDLPATAPSQLNPQVAGESQTDFERMLGRWGFPTPRGNDGKLGQGRDKPAKV